MATTRTFNAMLQEYLPNKMLMEELVKRDYLLNKVAKDEDWQGGDIIVPFKRALDRELLEIFAAELATVRRA